MGKNAAGIDLTMFGFDFLKKSGDLFSKRRRFYLNLCGDEGGPNIFGKRLKAELITQGWTYNRRIFDYNLSFVSGKYYPGKVNLLRLDGLYFDTENTVGNNDERNEPIKEAYYEFDKLIFQSEFSLKMFFKHFGETNKPHRIIYNGVPKSFSSMGPKYKYPFDKTLICSGKWRPHKRLMAIIDGFRKVETKGVGLAILGEGIPFQNEKNLIVLGHIPHQDLPFYLRGADAFVHLSWLDWCPNTVVEALACGLPVLCGHNGGTKELVRDCGIVLKLEETHNLQKVALYKPPMPDPKLIARGMSELLEWNRPVSRPDLHIDYATKKYVDFMLE